MTLSDLARLNKISVATASRYRSKGIDLRDKQAVNEHKRELRTRKGLSKFFHRSLSPTVQQAILTATADLERRIEALEEVVCSIHWLAIESPGPLSAEILERTAPSSSSSKTKTPHSG